MKRQLLSIASAVVLLLAVSAARAGEPTTAPSTVSGTVVSASASSLVVRGSAGEEHAFVVDAKTTLPESLSAGTKVTVEFKPLADGRKQATRVTVMTASGGTSDPPAGN